MDVHEYVCYTDTVTSLCPSTTHEYQCYAILTAVDASMEDPTASLYHRDTSPWSSTPKVVYLLLGASTNGDYDI